MPLAMITENLSGALEIAFYILLVIFLFHALFLAYHWFTYGNDRKLSLTAIIVYLGGGAVLFLSLGISLISISNII